MSERGPRRGGGGVLIPDIRGGGSIGAEESNGYNFKGGRVGRVKIKPCRGSWRGKKRTLNM